MTADEIFIKKFKSELNVSNWSIIVIQNKIDEYPFGSYKIESDYKNLMYQVFAFTEFDLCSTHSSLSYFR